MTAMLTAENITIDDADVRLAGETPRPRGATLVLRDADGAEIELPARIQRMLLAALASVAENGQASIGRLPKELTSTVAAEILSVSRPTLMKWVREGRISGFKVGTHTRFKREDVLALQEERKKERRAAFAALREDDAEWD
ncbi:helix-turn-helix domain-containing protein [Micrococcus endophyticus]|uniref:helix-turn-helix domain-containing protein n=1 Tax=Micrococcus endophyticus TaxID=455343 RepID=UPI003817833A